MQEKNKKTLNFLLNIVIELIKYFRMIYIDLSIDKSNIEKYRFKFHEELDTEVEEITDGLISADSMKIFLFLPRQL